MQNFQNSSTCSYFSNLDIIFEDRKICSPIFGNTLFTLTLIFFLTQDQNPQLFLRIKWKVTLWGYIQTSGNIQKYSSMHGWSHSTPLIQRNHMCLLKVWNKGYSMKMCVLAWQCVFWLESDNLANYHTLAHDITGFKNKTAEKKTLYWPRNQWQTLQHQVKCSVCVQNEWHYTGWVCSKYIQVYHVLFFHDFMWNILCSMREPAWKQQAMVDTKFHLKYNNPYQTQYMVASSVCNVSNWQQVPRSYPITIPCPSQSKLITYTLQTDVLIFTQVE